MTTQEQAVDAFLKNTSRNIELLQALLAHVEDHMGVAPEEVNWGHVGSAGKAREDLEELCRFLQVKV
ncbi:hypothetical protein RCRUDOLPH_85 [Rhodobacter phage RcRudolph]|nr:hypothetical protein RCRUDOLPH_85 [Rhodobacter phage RcRudolph]